MNKYRRLLLSLCLALVCCVGFLLENSTIVYAYTGDNCITYPLLFLDSSEPPTMLFRGPDIYENILQSSSVAFDSSDNVYIVNNTALNSVTWLSFGNSFTGIDFNYVPDLFDYYVMITVSGVASSAAEFSFCPTNFNILEKNCESGYVGHYLENLKVYHHDDANSVGFSVFGKMPEMCNTNIYGFNISDNSDGSVPANLKFEGLIIAVSKDNSEEFEGLLDSILEELASIAFSTDDTAYQTMLIEGHLDGIQDTIKNSIEEQYAMEEDESFGVEDIQDQVEDKMGVLAFGSDTLVSFLDLFSSENAKSTSLTFPGYTITLADGNSYKVWDDYEYDLATLEAQFPVLINAIRTIMVLCVWLAVLNYIVKAKDHFINNK